MGARPAAATATARRARPVEQALRAGQDVVFDIDWQGHRQLRAALPRDVVGVFVLPPSLAALEAGCAAVPATMRPRSRRRMGLARDEISHWAEFDHIVINADLAQAIIDVRAILHAARLTRHRQIGLTDFVRSLGAPDDRTPPR